MRSMILVLKQQQPQKNTITLTTGKWNMLYNVGSFVELEDRVIIGFAWWEMEENPPYNNFDCNRNVWCYDKRTKKIKWIIESPPIWKNCAGTIINKGRIEVDGVLYGYSEAYLGVDYNHFNDSIETYSDGRLFKLNTRNGKVVLLRDNLK